MQLLERAHSCWRLTVSDSLEKGWISLCNPVCLVLSWGFHPSSAANETCLGTSCFSQKLRSSAENLLHKGFAFMKIFQQSKCSSSTGSSSSTSTSGIGTGTCQVLATAPKTLHPETPSFTTVRNLQQFWNFWRSELRPNQLYERFCVRVFQDWACSVHLSLMA